MKTMIRTVLLLGAALAAGGAGGTAAAASPSADSGAADTAIAADDSALEAQLEAARKRLEEAAQQVAELSGQLGNVQVGGFATFATDGHRAIIGVQLDPSSGKEGARVVEVSPGGPAAEAGLRAGDTIVAVNGTDVTSDHSARQVIKLMREVKPDAKVSVRAVRDGKPHDFTIVARPGPGNMAFVRSLPQFDAWPPHPGGPMLIQGPLGDMELATLTPELGRYFGTDKGVLVVRAPSDGSMKLQDGDVILTIDGREPTSGSHATRILASYQPGEKLTLHIVRDHKTIDIEAKLPDRMLHKSVVIQREMLPDGPE